MRHFNPKTWHAATWTAVAVWIAFALWTNFPPTIDAPADYARFSANYASATGKPFDPRFVRFNRAVGFPFNYQQHQIMPNLTARLDYKLPCVVARQHSPMSYRNCFYHLCMSICPKILGASSNDRHYMYRSCYSFFSTVSTAADTSHRCHGAKFQLFCDRHDLGLSNHILSSYPYCTVSCVPGEKRTDQHWLHRRDSGHRRLDAAVMISCTSKTTDKLIAT